MSLDRTASRRFSASPVKLSRSVGSPGLLVTGLLQVTTVPFPKELYSPRHAMRHNSVCRRMELSRLTDSGGQRPRTLPVANDCFAEAAGQIRLAARARYQSPRFLHRRFDSV